MSSSNVASGTQGRTSAQHHASVPGHEPDVATIFRNVNKRARKDQHGRPTSWQSEQSRVASSPSKTAPPNDASRHRVYPRQNQGQCQSTPSQAQVSTLNVNRRPTTDMPQGQTHSQPPPFQHPQPQQSLPRSLESVKQSMDPQQPRPVRTVPSKTQAQSAWKIEDARREIEAMSPDARAHVINEMRQNGLTGQTQGRIQSNNLSTIRGSGYFSSPHVMPLLGWIPNRAWSEQIQKNHKNVPRPSQRSPVEPPAAPLPKSSAPTNGSLPAQGWPQFRQPPAPRPKARSAQDPIVVENGSETPPRLGALKRKRVDDSDSKKSKKPMIADARPAKRSGSGHVIKKGLTPAQMHERQWRLNKEKEDKEKQSQNEQKWARELQRVTKKAIAKIRVAGAPSVLPSPKVGKEVQPAKKSREHRGTHTSSTTPLNQHHPTAKPLPPWPVLAPNDQARAQANTSYTQTPTFSGYGQSIRPPSVRLPSPQCSLPKHAGSARQHGPPSGGPSSVRGVPPFAENIHKYSAQNSHAAIPQGTQHQPSTPFIRKRRRADDKLENEGAKQKKVKTLEDAPVSKVSQLPTQVDQATATENPSESFPTNSCSQDKASSRGEALRAGANGTGEQANDVDRLIDGCSKDAMEDFLGFDIDEALRQFAPQDHDTWGDAPYTNPIFTRGEVDRVSGPRATAPTTNEPEISTAREGRDDFWGILDIPGFDPAYTEGNGEAAPESSEPATGEMRLRSEKIARLVPNPTNEFGPLLDFVNAPTTNQEPVPNLPPFKADWGDFATASDNYVPDPDQYGLGGVFSCLN